MDYRVWMKMVAAFPFLAILWFLAVWIRSDVNKYESVALARQSFGEDSQGMHQQQFCAVHPTHKLGECGVPFKVKIGGTTVFLCRQTCTPSAFSNPERTLKSARELKTKAPKPMRQNHVEANRKLA